MDRNSAIARLLILKYVYRDVLPKDFSVKYYIPDNNINEEVLSRINGLYERAGKRYYIRGNLVEVMLRLKDVEPYAKTWQKYDKVYMFPELLFNLNQIASARPFIHTYYVPQKEDMVILNPYRFRKVKVESYDGFVRYDLERQNQVFMALLQVFEDRPPYRGLIWNAKDIKDIDWNFLIDSVRLRNLSEKKFPPLTYNIKVFVVNGRRYYINKMAESNPVLPMGRQTYLVETKENSKWKTRQIDTHIGEKEVVDFVKRFIKERGFDILNTETFNRFLRENGYEKGEVIEGEGYSNFQKEIDDDDMELSLMNRRMFV